MRFYIRATDNNRFTGDGTKNWLRVGRVDIDNGMVVFKNYGDGRLGVAVGSNRTYNLEFAVGKYPDITKVSYEQWMEYYEQHKS